MRELGRSLILSTNDKLKPVGKIIGMKADFTPMAKATMFLDLDSHLLGINYGNKILLFP